MRHPLKKLTTTINLNPTPSAVGLTGFDPVYQKVSDFQFGEKIAFSGPAQNLITLSVPANTPNRKIYAWLWASAAANFLVQGVITFYVGQSPMGALPVSIAGGTFGQQSVASVCTTNGSNVQDCLGVYLTQTTGNQPASLILQPLYLYGNFDSLTFSVINQPLGVTSMRALLACISSQ